MSIELTSEFRQALDLLDEGSNLFLTGKAGTGKSTLIRHFMNNTSGKVVVAAPTGIAALNVGGYTLHQLFGFRPGTTLEDVRAKRVKPGRMTKVLKGVRTLIIDEASMVRADLFDQVVAALTMYGPQPGTPFGGVQLVLVGDLFQLPPVVKTEEEEYFRTRYSTPYFFSADSFSREDFPVIQLTKVFRQVGDPEMVDLLNAIRDGRMNRAAEKSLNTHYDPDFEPPADEYWVTLATTNNIVRSRNRQRLDALDTPTFVSFASSSGDIKGFDKPTDSELAIKVGAQIMMLTNDPSGRWANGTMGKIVHIAYDPDDRDAPPEKRDLEVDVELPDGGIVTVTPHVWDVTKPALSGGELTQEIVGTFRQLPFKLAWAITIHKSQGQTLPRAIIDLSGGTRATGQLYVALSRCTALSGMVLTRKIFPRDVKVDHRVRTFLSESVSRPAAHYRAIECLLVGEGDGYVRPIDIAVVDSDGIATETLINPTRDVGTAVRDYGLTASMLQVAPTLTEAWPVIEEAIGGFGLVSREPRALSILDTELKRTGIVSGLESVATIKASGRAGQGDRSASKIALSTWELYESARESISAQEYNPLDESAIGYTLTRDMRIEPYGDPAEVAAILSTKLAGLRVSEETREVVKNFESRYGVKVDLPEAADSPSIDDVLVPEARVCFTGTAMIDGRVYEREDMQDMALKAGLRVAPGVSKTRCDALVAADPATQSSKARKAAEYGKPIFSVDEFVTWVKEH